MNASLPESLRSPTGLVAGIAGLGYCLFATSALQAQTTDSVIVDLGPCIGIEARARRVACYEARVQEVLSRREYEAAEAQSRENAVADSPPSETSAAESTDRRDARRAARETTRRDRDLAEAPDDASAADEDTAERESSLIIASVTSIREIAPNELLIELDNGQIWRQNHPKRYRLRAGDEVTVRPTRWGTSFRLTDPDLGSFIQVERLR